MKNRGQDWLRRKRVADMRNNERKALGSGAGFVGQVTGTTRTGLMSIMTPVGPRDLPALNPYESSRSWIRVRPESLSNVMVMMRGDNRRPATVAYSSDPDVVPRRINAHLKGTHYYPPLEEGEWHMRTPGFALLHGKRDGTLSLRGGASTFTLDNVRLMSEARSPVHSRLLGLVNGGDTAEGAWEGIERYGAVRRGGDWVKATDSTSRRFHAHEYMRVTSWPGTPRTLTDLREGWVVEDDGSIAISKTTGKRLRMRWMFASRDDGSATVISVDESGTLEMVAAQSIYLTANANIHLQAPSIKIKDRLVEPRSDRI